MHRRDHQISVLADQAEVPGIGYLAVNCFVLGGPEPVVVDTGMGLEDRDFLGDLSQVMDPADVRWIWLTHPDRDHTGGLVDLLAAAPRARVVTTFLGVGIMSTESPLPLDRVFLLNPGQTLDAGGRSLTAFRPPTYDSPATTGFLDHTSGAVFTSDCFGAPVATVDQALAEDAREIPADALQAGQVLWTTIDSPWIHHVDPVRLGLGWRKLVEMSPTSIYSTHLPAATGMTAEFVATLSGVPQMAPFVGPDQAALEQMLAGFAPAGAPS